MAGPAPRFLLFEPMHEAGTRLLREQGEVIVAPALDEATLRPLLAGADAVVLRNQGGLPRALIEAAPRLKVIGRHGAGLDTIDLQAATERGIRVVHTPEANAQSVAEHFVAMALVLSKRILEADRALRDGHWEVRNQYCGRELAGKTLGVVGYGRIGQATARICHHGFGMPVLYCSRTAAAAPGERVDLDTLLRSADYVSLNLPLTPETRHLLGRERIRRMRPAAYLLNLGRGALWDERAVLEALDAGWIAGAGSDVFEQEPAALDHPLFRHRNFVCTPHMSAHTEEALRRMSLVAEDVLAVLAGREPRWPAN